MSIWVSLFCSDYYPLVLEPASHRHPIPGQTLLDIYRGQEIGGPSTFDMRGSILIAFKRLCPTSRSRILSTSWCSHPRPTPSSVVALQP
jgi:hypothetical protein